MPLMEEEDRLAGWIKQKERAKLVDTILKSSIFEDDPFLAYLLWDTFLPEARPEDGRVVPVSDKTADQIENDIIRSISHFKDIPSDDIGELRGQLSELLLSIFKRPFFDSGRDQLHYYQGFHDIASVVLIKFGPKKSAKILSRLARSHLVLFMDADFSSSRLVSDYIMALLALTDPKMHGRLVKIEMPPFFFVSWFLTWFSHDLADTRQASKIFNFLLLLPPNAIAYLCVALLKAGGRQVVLGTEQGDSEAFGLLHASLKKLPRQKWTEKILSDGLNLMTKYPPNLVPGDWPFILQERLNFVPITGNRQTLLTLLTILVLIFAIIYGYYLQQK